MDAILLYAKQSGITSFTSLWAAKRAVNTTKVGHTGTLDNFADGLLVVLVNRIRKLTSHITDFDKTYEAVIRFGCQTDTLDTDGVITARAPLPSEEAFRAAVPEFIGSFGQLPPVYSAIQIGGMRSSALARSGSAPDLASRPVTIHALDIVDFTGEYAHIRVHCSKGTYIRSLARDLAQKAGSCGYLAALRRTAIGPFLLADAAGFEFLPHFDIELAQKRVLARENGGNFSPSRLAEPDAAQIIAAMLEFTPEIAATCGFAVCVLNDRFLEDFLAGKKIRSRWFDTFAEAKAGSAVFAARSGRLQFCGLIARRDSLLKYVFVLQTEKPAANPLKANRAARPQAGAK